MDRTPRCVYCGNSSEVSMRKRILLLLALALPAHGEQRREQGNRVGAGKARYGAPRRVMFLRDHLRPAD